MATLLNDVRVMGLSGRPSQVVSTSARTVTIHDSGKTLTNAGANGSVTFTLPAAVPGLKYTFVNGYHNSDTLVVTRAGSDAIYFGEAVASSGSLTTTEPGVSVTIECVLAGYWSATAFTGPWT